MTKKTEIEDEVKGSPMKYKTIDLLKMVRDGFSDFHNTTDNEKKLEYLMDVVFGVFVYNLLRYDYHNYVRLFEKSKEEK